MAKQMVIEIRITKRAHETLKKILGDVGFLEWSKQEQAKNLAKLNGDQEEKENGC